MDGFCCWLFREEKEDVGEVGAGNQRLNGHFSSLWNLFIWFFLTETDFKEWLQRGLRDLGREHSFTQPLIHHQPEP